MSITVYFREPHVDAEHPPLYEAQAKPGDILMRVGLALGLDNMAADCGGNLTCATCHVMVDPAWVDKLPPVSEDEDSMLDYAAVARQPNSRLSCQIQLTPELNGLVVDLPSTQY
jgi:ferredoxin, 2Fe-2S